MLNALITWLSCSFCFRMEGYYHRICINLVSLVIASLLLVILATLTNYQVHQTLFSLKPSFAYVNSVKQNQDMFSSVSKHEIFLKHEPSNMVINPVTGLIYIHLASLTRTGVQNFISILNNSTDELVGQI